MQSHIRRETWPCETQEVTAQYRVLVFDNTLAHFLNDSGCWPCCQSPAYSSLHVSSWGLKPYRLWHRHHPQPTFFFLLAVPQLGHLTRYEVKRSCFTDQIKSSLAKKNGISLFIQVWLQNAHLFLNTNLSSAGSIWGRNPKASSESDHLLWGWPYPNAQWWEEEMAT